MRTSHIRTLVLTGVVAALAAGCSQGAKLSVDTSKITDAIHADETRWNADWTARSAGGVASHFAKDGTFMPANGVTATGPAAIGGAVKDILDDAGFTLALTGDTVEVSASGDMAISHGIYTETDTDPRTKSIVNSQGSYVTIYKPQPDGSWQAYWHIYTPANGTPATLGAPASSSPLPFG